jgi:hypothetical protein
VILAFLTRAAFLGLIVRAPFLGPRTVARRVVFAVGPVGLPVFIAPCAILYEVYEE